MELSEIIMNLRQTLSTVAVNVNFIKGEAHANCDKCSEAMQEITKTLKHQSDMFDLIEQLSEKPDKS